MEPGECLLPFVPETFVFPFPTGEYKGKNRESYIMVLHIAMNFVVQSS
jgi:hypothetical protein